MGWGGGEGKREAGGGIRDRVRGWVWFRGGRSSGRGWRRAGCVLVFEVVVPGGVEAEVLEHAQVLLDGAVEGGEVIADHEGAGAGGEDQALEVAEVLGAAAGHHDFLSGKQEAEAGDGLEGFQGWDRGEFFERGSLDGVEDVDGDDVGPDGAQFEGEVAAILAGFAHADDAARADADPGVLEVAEGLDAILERMAGAVFGEEASGTLQVVPVALDAGFAEPAGDRGLFDDAERDVDPDLSLGLEFADAVADLLEHGSLVEALPGGDEAEGGHLVAAGFGGGLHGGFGIDEPVAGGFRLVEGGLRAELAVLRAAARLGVHDRAEVDLVALEMLADAVGPGEEFEPVGG
jgi:hypothetical protein